jgi:hypothetical protein
MTADLPPETARWIDVDGKEFESIEHSKILREALHDGIEEGHIRVDTYGYLWKGDMPVHTEVNGEVVKIRYSVRAAN